MDPIHPIVPQPPRLAPVNPSPAVDGVQQRREQQRQAAERERRRQRQREQQREREDPSGDLEDRPDGQDDDGRPHIDVTA